MSRTLGSKEITAGEASRPGEDATRRKPWVWPHYEVLDFDDTEAGPAAGPDGFSSVS
jgi:hypothetical protein